MNATVKASRGIRGVADRKGVFGAKLKLLRLKAGWSVYALSKKSGVTQINISQIEKGKRDPAWATAVKLANALGVSMSEFDDVPETPPVANSDEPTPADE